MLGRFAWGFPQSSGITAYCLLPVGLELNRSNDMAKADPKQYAASLALYEKLVALNPKVERKGAIMPYTSLNGHMFSLLTREGWLALRLPSDARDAFLKKYQTKLCVQYGTVMKEYVQVPDALLEKTRELRKYFDLSYAYVGSLKPKPTTKKAGAKKR
jgi:TfoX/Sxy family transcriptional regulator of competence genes